MRVPRVMPLFAILEFLESCEPLFDDLGFLCLHWKGVFVLDLLNFQAVIKSVASAASPKTKIQESTGASGRRLGWRTMGTARLP